VDARKLVEGGVHVEKAYLMNYRAENPDPVPLLFQAGYLTIRGYDDRYDEYSLGIPNLEVKDGLLSGLLSEYTRVPPHWTARAWATSGGASRRVTPTACTTS
jgi:hypothetical protein